MVLAVLLAPATALTTYSNTYYVSVVLAIEPAATKPMCICLMKEG